MNHRNIKLENLPKGLCGDKAERFFFDGTPESPFQKLWIIYPDMEVCFDENGKGKTSEGDTVLWSYLHDSLQPLPF